MDSIMQYGYSALDRGLIPDSVLRPVIRQLCRQRLREINKGVPSLSHVPSVP